MGCSFDCRWSDVQPIEAIVPETQILQEKTANRPEESGTARETNHESRSNTTRSVNAKHVLPGIEVEGGPARHLRQECSHLGEVGLTFGYTPSYGDDGDESRSSSPRKKANNVHSHDYLMNTRFQLCFNQVSTPCFNSPLLLIHCICDWLAPSLDLRRTHGAALCILHIAQSSLFCAA